MSACRALSPLDLHARFVAAPETRAAIDSRLFSRGVRKEDIEDETQNVLAELLEADPVSTLDDCVALGRHIANQRAVDYLRRRAKRGKHNAGLIEDADDHVQDDNAAGFLLSSIDSRRKLGVFQQEVEAGRITKRQVSIVARAADGYDDAEIARSLKIPNQAVRNALTLTRKISRSAWAKHLGAVGALGIAILFLYWLRDRREEAKIEPDRIAPVPSVPHLPPEPTPEERAATLRRNALHDCDVGNLPDCLQRLDEAKELDPAGDTAPTVQKARQRIRDSRPVPDTKVPRDIK